MFIARDVSKFSEEDNWGEGCLPNTGQNFDLGVQFSGKTAAEVIEKIANFLGQKPEDAEKNVCDEPGRVEFGVTEREDGTELSKREFEQWKRGEIKAWYCVYTAYIEEALPVKL